MLIACTLAISSKKVYNAKRGTAACESVSGGRIGGKKALPVDAGSGVGRLIGEPRRIGRQPAGSLRDGIHSRHCGGTDVPDPEPGNERGQRDAPCRARSVL